MGKLMMSQQNYPENLATRNNISWRLGKTLIRVIFTI